jgi:hypothetical protein
MADVLIRFEREGLEGVVAVGTYLSDAASRMGISLMRAAEADGEREEPVTIVSGGGLLSAETFEEAEFFEKHGREKDQRLASKTRVEKAGEVTIMTNAEPEIKNEKNDAETAEPSAAERDINAAFGELPLEKKIAQLVRLEAVALGETLSFVVESPFMVFDKVMDVLAEFGLKKESAEKDATRPKEHTEAAAAAEPAEENAADGDADNAEASA